MSWKTEPRGDRPAAGLAGVDPGTPEGASPAVEVSVLVVSYRTRDLTLECLRSLYESARDLALEVWVVDNDSGDGSVEAIRERFPAAGLIPLGENRGFAAGVNLAAARARGRYLLLLNPDTVVLDDAVSRLLAFAREHPRAGIWGGRTLHTDGSPQPRSCWGRPTLWSTFCRSVGLSTVFRRSKWLNPEEIGAWSRAESREVDIVSGCFFLIDRAVWEELGGFDPAFFLYGEEADLCMRAKRRGYSPRVTSTAAIVHHGGASEPNRADKWVRLLSAKARLMRKHWSPPAARLGVPLLGLGTVVRAAAYSAAALVRARYRETARSWRDVARRWREWSRA